jgi:cytochrome c oxidase subunit 2
MQRGNRGGRRARGTFTVALAAVLAACSEGLEYPQTTFQPVTDYGDALNRVFANTFWWTMLILVLVTALILFVIVRFREQPGQPHPKQIHGNTRLELIWTIIPAIIVVLIGIPTVQTIFATQGRPADDALVVEVIGHQWWWEFRYPEQNVVTANQFYVPVGRQVHLRIHSADVIHSFWVPRLGGKRDANPLPRTAEGERQRYNHILFTANEPGVFSGQCAEFCGESHGIMAISAVAVPADDFEAWVVSMRDPEPPPPATQPAPADTLAGAPDTTAGDSAAAAIVATPPPAAQDTGAPPAQQQPQAPVDSTGLPLRGTPQQLQRALAGEQPVADPSQAALIAEGQRIFLSKPCIACHSIAGTTARGVVGPNLTRFGDRPTVGAGALPNTQENVVRWIIDPRAVKAGALMPGTREPAAGFPATGLTDEETRAVAAYLLSLR